MASSVPEQVNDSTRVRDAASVPAAGPPALRVEAISKTFQIPHQRYSTLKERVLHPFASREFDPLHAIDDVSFEVASGEFFGIVGRNGSGKSTLLKALAGIYQTDTGTIDIHGRLSPFIELGVGFNVDLTARENVMINAIMLGLSRREARRRFDEIIAFAELEDFVDLKLKNYSSGMSVRLGFSVAIQVDADILLVDEVLAVGDASFQQKCFEQFQRLKDERRTIVFVTHDMSAVERFCDRAMLVERGRMVDIGEPEMIAREYNRLNFGRLKHEEGTPPAAAGADALPAQVMAAWFEDEQGERCSTFGPGEWCWVCFEVTFNEDQTDPLFGWALRNEARHIVFGVNSIYEARHTGTFRAGETVIARCGFWNRLATSQYTVSPWVARDGAGTDVLDARDDLASMHVHSTRHTGGVVDLEQRFELAYK